MEKTYKFETPYGDVIETKRFVILNDQDNILKSFNNKDECFEYIDDLRLRKALLKDEFGIDYELQTSSVLIIDIKTDKVIYEEYFN